MDQRFDVLIGGGGLNGLAMAVAMTRAGFAVALIDPVPESDTLAPGFDGRVSALTRASMRLFEHLDVWRHIGAEAQAIEQVLVSDGGAGRPASPLTLLFDAAERGDGAPLGYIAENRTIRAALVAAAAGITRLTDSIANVAPGAQSVATHLRSGTVVRARLLIAADGRDSALRRLMGIGKIGWEYGQSGIVACVHHEKPHQGVAYEHFLPPGPFAVLPMTGNRCSLVWTEKTRDAERLMALPQEAFEAEIAARFGPHLGKVAAASARWCYPLRLTLARAFIGKRFALIGDAAHAIHPLAGQNFNLGLKDVAALAEIAREADAIGLDIGSDAVLQRYQRRRRPDGVGAGFTMDAINRIFSNDIPPLRLARDLGLATADAIGPLRRLLMRMGTGV